MDNKKSNKLKIGLALGKGTARGFAHIGVLKILEENGIKPDMIAGTSAGAIAGALYASGMSPDVIKRTLLKTEWKEMFDFVTPVKGMVKGDKLEEYLRLLTQNKNFEDLSIPLFITATNVTKRKKIVFSKGNVAKAVRASMAIPGIFTPLSLDKDDYIDGGITNPIPVDVLKENGADIIIAVDLSSDMRKMSSSQSKSKFIFLKKLEKKFIFTQVDYFKQFAKEFIEAADFATKLLPKWLKKKLKTWAIKIIDIVIKPTVMLKYFRKTKTPKILSTLYTGMNIMEDELSEAKLGVGIADVIIRPQFRHAGWSDVDKGKYFMDRGAQATKESITKIKNVIRIKTTIP
jgi:predicted acylesterase/phospholipase RssA